MIVRGRPGYFMVDHIISWLTMVNDGFLPCFVKQHHGFDHGRISPGEVPAGVHLSGLSANVGD